MILIDFSQIMRANMAVQINMGTFGENEFRNLVFQSLRKYNREFREEYGEMFICCDASYNWRKDYFPFYKAKRKTDREESGIDWTEAFRIFNRVTKDVYEYLPYRVISIEQTEADDVIGVLATRRVTENGVLVENTEPTLIVSGDKDFRSLLVHNHIKLYHPVNKEFITEENPKEYLMNLILEGDKGDGVPNVLSDDDTFVTEGKRQTPLTKKKKSDILEKITTRKLEELPTKIQQNIQRNINLIDLARTPKELKMMILKIAMWPPKGTMQKTFNFLIKSNLSTLLNDIEGFKPGELKYA